MESGMSVRLQRWALDGFGVLVIALMLCIVVQVIANALGISVLAHFGRALTLVGTSISINVMMDLQWHLLTLVGLLPAALAWSMDRHVRVDFLYGSLGARSRTLVEIAGHAFFSLPFLVFCIPAAWSFAERALANGEHSRDGGMTDRWMIKGVIPIALALLLVVVLIDLARRLAALVKGR